MIKENNVKNKLELRVIGISRSGNHAIINWIAENRAGITRFLNHVTPGLNPYEHKHYYYQWKDKQKIDTSCKFSTIDCLIYSYENHRLSYINNKLYEKNRQNFVGYSENKKDILILRDPFNHFASILKSGMNASSSWLLNFNDLWIEYAEEFTGNTNQLSSDKIFINYNKWFKSSKYRKKLAIDLALDVEHLTFPQNVAKFGGGSSFDSTRFDGKANKMDIEKRYISYKENTDYIRLFNDARIINLAEEIFDLDSDLQTFIQNRLLPEASSIASVIRWAKKA